MAQPYLDDLEQLIDLEAGAADREAITCKHFFSGAAAYVDGKIFATLTPVGLAFKLSDASCTALLAADAEPLQYFPAAPIKRGYALFTNPQQLASGRTAALLAESVGYVRTT